MTPQVEQLSPKRKLVLDIKTADRFSNGRIEFSFPSSSSVDFEMPQDRLFLPSENSNRESSTGCQILDILENLDDTLHEISIFPRLVPVGKQIVIDSPSWLSENEEVVPKQIAIEKKHNFPPNIRTKRTRLGYSAPKPRFDLGAGANSRLNVMRTRREMMKFKCPEFDLFPFAIFDQYWNWKVDESCQDLDDVCKEDGCGRFATVFVCYCRARKMCAEHALYNYIFSWISNQCGCCRGNKDKIVAPVIVTDVVFGKESSSPSCAAFKKIVHTLVLEMTKRQRRATETQFRQIRALILEYY